MKLFNGFTKTEKRIFAGALLIALICLAVFTSDSLFRSIFSSESRRSNAEQIGTIENLTRDVRFKSARTFEWDQANPTQGIHLGDALYAGDKSKAKITLGSGKSVELQSNSLIRFTEIDGQKLSDLQFGNFRVKIDGTMKVAIHGVATTIEGDGAEADLEISQTGPPQIKVIKGQITTHASNKPSAPKKKFIAKAEPAPMNLVEEPVPVKPEPVISSPVPVELASLVSYHLKLYDLYSASGERLIPNPNPLPRSAAVSLKLAWETNFPSTVEFEIASDNMFSVGAQRTSTNKQIYTPDSVNIGPNFWHVRSVGGPWSKTQSFEVATSLVAGSPRFANAKYSLNLLNGAAPFSLNWTSASGESSKSWNGYVLEVSTTPEFLEASTNRIWKKTPQADFTFHLTGQRFVRVRGVNEKNQLTDFSDIAVIEIVDPPLVEPPRLSQAKIELQPSGNSNVQAHWQSVPKAKAYAYEFNSTENQNSVKSGRQTSTSFAVTQLPPGHYTVQVASIDRFDRVGLYSQAQALSVLPAPLPPPQPQLESPPKSNPELKPLSLEMATREPAAEPEEAATSTPKAQMSAKLKIEDSSLLNESYRDSHLQLEGTNTVMVSNVEQALGRQAPLTGGLALRTIRWFDRSNGAEVSVKSKVIGYNAAGQSSSPFSFEGRYERRWFLPWTWISALREIQISALAGLEAYRNSNSGLFATSYNAAKLGFGLEFPVAHHWDTGGEVLAGLTTDMSKKYEFSGHLHYNFTKRTSFGLGYRVNIFDAGSTASSPVNGLPYREAYGEGYTVLRMSY